MRFSRYLLARFSIAMCITRVFGQTNFVYDQQSALEGAVGEGGGGIVSSQPFGQSFVPTFDSVGFVRLWMGDANTGNGTGSVVYVNLLSGSITGAVLGTSASVALPDGYGNITHGYPDFIFTNPVSVVPGITYFLRPVRESGDAVIVTGDVTYNYLDGVMFIQGTPRPLQDLWFREGIITVPEPSVVALGLAGAGVLVWRQVRRRARAARKV